MGKNWTLSHPGFSFTFNVVDALAWLTLKGIQGIDQRLAIRKP